MLENKFELYLDPIEEAELILAQNGKGCFDTWGVCEYGNDNKAVDYNAFVETYKGNTEGSSAFYRIYYNEKTGYWEHDSCGDFVPYEIDFSDKNWKENLEEAAAKAYEILWEDEYEV